jgi:hypothetical protein
MANTEHENVLGVTDRRRTQGQAKMPGALHTDARYLSVGDLRTTLATRVAGYYTSTRLDQMTKNDMVYALRTIDDAAGF